ncbi:MAG: protoporphyrinogen oxidase [Acidimicrobiales bacterium]|nr:protoporphyrinogen oxidase [Acidimicrobiales bacterium]
MTGAATRPERAVVVGGGIAGLTAAFRLSQAGTAVTVVEPDRIGGKLQTSVFAGRSLDETADNFLLRVPWAAALCHDLEIDGELISPVARRAEIFLDGTRRAMPEGHLLGVPADLEALRSSGILSPEGMARVEADLTLPRLPTDPPVQASDPPGDDPPGDGSDDVAVGPYLRGRLGDEVVDHLIDPLIGGINAGDTNRLSLTAVVPQIDAAARSGDPSLIRSCAAQIAKGGDAVRPVATGGSGAAPPVFATPIGGMARIVDALLAFMPSVDLLVGRRVEAIEPSAPSAWRVVLDDGTALDTDAVVVACPAFAAAPLLAPLAPGAAATLAAIDHSSISMVAFVFDRDHLRDVPTDVSGCLVPKDQGTLLTAISYGTSKWPQWRVPERDDVVLRVSAGRFGDDRHLHLSDGDLVATLLADLDRVLGVSGDPAAVRVGRWPRSFPQYAPGHLARISRVEAELTQLGNSPTAGIVLAGAALRGVGVPACIRSGEEAAAALGATWPTRRQLST